MTKISIITINFNNIEGLKKTLPSVINQSNKNFEYILIDGGSNDGSAAYIEKHNSFITYWVSEKDNGIYNAMNKGIRVASGEYVLFINSGDCFADHLVLERVSSNLMDDNCIIYGNLLQSKNGNIISKLIPPKHLDFSYFVTNSLPHPATFIKRQLFFSYFFYNENLKIVADWEFFIYCICKQNELYKHIDVTISIYDIDGISNNIHNRNQIFAEENIVFDRHFRAMLSNVEWIRNIKTKRLTHVNTLAQKKTRWKILKAIIIIFTRNKKVQYTKPVYKKINK